VGGYCFRAEERRGRRPPPLSRGGGARPPAPPVGAKPPATSSVGTRCSVILYSQDQKPLVSQKGVRDAFVGPDTEVTFGTHGIFEVFLRGLRIFVSINIDGVRARYATALRVHFSTFDRIERVRSGTSRTRIAP
jgi:hypothetical protein